MKRNASFFFNSWRDHTKDDESVPSGKRNQSIEEHDDPGAADVRPDKKRKGLFNNTLDRLTKTHDVAFSRKRGRDAGGEPDNENESVRPDKRRKAERSYTNDVDPFAGQSGASDGRRNGIYANVAQTTSADGSDKRRRTVLKAVVHPQQSLATFKLKRSNEVPQLQSHTDGSLGTAIPVLEVGNQQGPDGALEFSPFAGFSMYAVGATNSQGESPSRSSLSPVEGVSPLTRFAPQLDFGNQAWGQGMFVFGVGVPDSTPQQTDSVEVDRMSVTSPAISPCDDTTDLPVRRRSATVGSTDRQVEKRLEKKRFFKSFRGVQMPGGARDDTPAVLQDRSSNAQEEGLTSIAYEDCEAKEAPTMYDQHGRVVIGLETSNHAVAEDAHPGDGEDRMLLPSRKSRFSVFSKARGVGHSRNDSTLDEAQVAEQALARAESRFSMAGLAHGLMGLGFGKQRVSETGNDADDEAESDNDDEAGLAEEDGENAVAGPSERRAFKVRDFALEHTPRLDREMRFGGNDQESQCRGFMDSYSEGRKHVGYGRAITRHSGSFEAIDNLPECDRGRTRNRTGRGLVFGEFSAEQRADVLSWWKALDIEQL